MPRPKPWAKSRESLGGAPSLAIPRSRLSLCDGRSTRKMRVGKVPARRTTARSALASVATATFALSKLFQTSTAMKPTSRAKRMPNGGSIPGESALKARARSFTRELGHYPISTSGKEINGRKDNDGHPQHRKIEQPVAHLATFMKARQSFQRAEVEQNSAWLSVPNRGAAFVARGLSGHAQSLSDVGKLLSRHRLLAHPQCRGRHPQ